MTKYGVQLPNRPDAGSDGPFEQLAGLAVSAEVAGFDSVWVVDDGEDIPPPGDLERPALESYTLLGALAVRTERVELGLLSTAADRHPGILAKMATTLDVISNGRAIVGFGRAWHDLGPDGLGGADPGGAVQEDLLEESLQICRALFAEDDATYDGRHFLLDHARNLPRPVRPGGPEILIEGEPQTLHLVAQYADRCSVSGDAATLARTIEELHRHCDAVGRDPTEVGVTWMARLVLTTSDRQTVEVIRMMEEVGTGQSDGEVVVGQPHQVPDLIAGHLGAGADGVTFRVPHADSDAIGQVGRSLGLTTG